MIMRLGLLPRLLLLLLVAGQHLLEPGAWAQRVAELRTGTIELSTWPDVRVPAAAARPPDAESSASTRSAAVDGDSTAAAAAGLGPGAAAAGALGLFLVAYTPGPAQLRLHASLTSRGARLLSYVRPHTWVVVMTEQAAAEVAAESGAAMAPLGPPHRIDPEWQPLLEEVEAAAVAAAAEVAQRRRRRGGRRVLGDDSEDGRVEEDAGEDTTPAALAAEVGRRAARALSQLRPLAGSGGAADTSAGSRRHHRRRRQAAEEQPASGAGEEQGAADPLMYGVLVSLLPVPQLTAEAVDDLAADLPAALAAALGLQWAAPAAAGVGARATRPPCWPLVEVSRGPGGGSNGGSSGGGSGSGPPLLQAHVCPQHLPAAVAWLSRLWQTQWLEPQWVPQLQNAVANIIGQTGGLSSMFQYTAPLTVRKPYWDAGLDGTGEVVGVTDTGVDMTSCYFYDSRYGAVMAALAASSAAGPLTQAMPGARKVVAYSVIQGAAYGDPSGGHGTHTSGTVAGAVPAGGPGASSGPGAGYRVDNATGAAPGAALSVIDISTREGGLTLASPMDKTLLQVHANAGARITSDSWGVLSRDYTAAVNDFDRFLWSNDDHVALASAGNYGQSPGLRSGQVTSPANAKNVIAVGASLRSPPFTLYYPFYTVRGRRASSGAAWSQQVWPIECRDLGARSFMTALGGTSRNATLELVALTQWSLQPRPPPTTSAQQQPGDGGGGDAPAAPLPGPAPAFSSACEVPPSLVASGVLVGAVVVAPASLNCSLVDQVLALQRAGAAAALLGYTDLSNPPTPVLVATAAAALSSTGVTIPMGYITQALCSWLLGNMSDSVRPVTFGISQSATDGINSVASFSSAGPALDGRIKPDIVAPGFQLTSAWRTDLTAGDTCGLAVAARSGTSMSTPTAAGHTALMRQYLRTGYYPAGSPADPAAAPFSPSGTLLKGLIIAGAKSLEGGTAMATRETLGPPPDGYQGWGRLSLAGSLPLPGLTPAGFSLQVADRGQFTASGQQAVLTGLTATGAGPVSIVLTWYDYPSFPNAPVKLVNDLDLSVAVQPAPGAPGPAARVLLGNNPEDAAAPAADRLNTVERVWLSAPPPGAALTITVAAADLPSLWLSSDANYTDAALPQRWAVAVVGHFSGTLATELNPAYVRQGQLGLLQPPPPPPSPVKPSPPRPRKLPPPSSSPPPSSPSPSPMSTPSPKKPGKFPKPPPPSPSPSPGDGNGLILSTGGGGAAKKKKPPPPPKMRGRA